MAQAIRNLQLFRNGNIAVGSVAAVKQTAENMFAQGNLVLHDGEPIHIRYRLTNNGEIKSLFGVAYVDSQNAQNNKILWNESEWTDISIVTHPTADEYVTLKYTYDQQTKQYDLVVDANVMMLDEACGCALEITAIANEIKLYIKIEEATFEEVNVGDLVSCGSDLYYLDGKEEYTEAQGKSMEPGGEFDDEGGIYQYGIYEAQWTGLADACDVKRHIKYYNVVSGDNIVTISSSTTTDMNGFGNTTFTVTISTENLPSAPNYTIGAVSAIGTSLKSYALFKDGVQVGETIDIPKDFLVKSGEIIEIVEENNNFYDNTNDPQHTTPLTGVSAAGLYLDFVVNVKIGTAEPDEHIYIPVNSLVDAYTAGDGITISTTNVVSARISTDTGNMISISQTDGGLFVPAGETIVDVANINSECSGTPDAPTYYGYYGNQYVVITKTGSNPDTYEYNGQSYTGPVGGPVPCGHRYLIVRTSGGNMYMTNNDTSSDIHVSSFTLTTNTRDEEVLRITMNDNNVHDVLVSDINPTIPEATVNWNTANDELLIGTEGIFTQLALSTIEAYIDNFDCGTFTI